MKYLLDSGALVGAINGRLPVVLRLGELKPGDVAVSAVSRFEAEAALRTQPRLQARCGRLLREFLAVVRVIDFGPREAQQAAGLAAESPGLPALDLLVAGTALEHRLVVATLNIARYAALASLEVEDWTRLRAQNNLK